MKSVTGPQIVCRELPAFQWDQLDSVRRAFEGFDGIPLRQAWLPGEESDFAPAYVRVGWREEALFIFAELTDIDIFTRATRHNSRMWELGDAFEIFLRPDSQETYSEFHVAPGNLRLQLRLANPQVVKDLAKINAFEKAMIDEPLFDSAVWVRPEEKRWLVSSKIPVASIWLPPGPMLGAKWHFSFSRYDYTRGRPKPVISSSSPHTEPRFHNQSEWGALQFVK